MKKTFFFLSTITLLIVAGCGKEGGATKTEPIHLGFIAPVTGDLANLGNDALVSAQIAVDEINAEGGIDGRSIKLLVGDGKCSAKDAPQAASKLINIDGVSAFFAMCSPEVISTAGMANEQKRVVLSSCASSPNVTDAGDYIFRTYPSDTFQGKFAAEYAYNRLGKRKVAILAMQNDWGLGLRGVFAKTFQDLGGEIVLIQEHAQDSRDLRTQITKIKESRPDFIYFPSFTEPSLVGIKQMRDLGINIDVMGGDAWNDPKFQEEEYTKGLRFTIPAANYNSHWKEEMTKRGAGHTVCAPSAYDNVKILADIMKRVGEDGEKIKNELYKVKGYKGINGDISFDENGDITEAQYEIIEIQ